MFEIQLEESIRLQLADNQTTIEMKAFVELEIELITHAGSLKIRSAQCYISEHLLEYAYIGNRELKSLGIDPKSTLLALIRDKRQCSKQNMITDTTSSMASVPAAAAIRGLPAIRLLMRLFGK